LSLEFILLLIFLMNFYSATCACHNPRLFS
jgi:hypothetical protein